MFFLSVDLSNSRGCTPPPPPEQSRGMTSHTHMIHQLGLQSGCVVKQNTENKSQRKSWFSSTKQYCLLTPPLTSPPPLKQWSASPTTCGSVERSGSAVAVAAWVAAAAGAAGPCGASQSEPPSPPALWGCSEPPASHCPWLLLAAPLLSRGAHLPHSAGF